MSDCSHANQSDHYQDNGDGTTTCTVTCNDCGAVLGSQTWRHGSMS